jgi:hypothetical protein
MGLILAIVAIVLFVIAALDKSIGSFEPGQLVAAGLAFLTGALIAGVNAAFIRSRV